MTSGPAGLASSEAASRLARDGPNQLPSVTRTPAWRLLVAQLIHFFAVMLWVAAVLAVVAGMPQLAVAIVVIIVENGVFAFAQEARAERASERLLELLPVQVMVMRDGAAVRVDAAEVVVGDLVVLSPGDRIVADLDAVDVHGLEADESMLTGESRPVTVVNGARLWAGTFVVNGEGRATAVATGGATRLAGIAELTSSAQRPPGPLAVELQRIVRVTALLTVSAGVAFFVLTRFTGMSARDGFLFAVGVTVALVPEGLLPTLTLSLSMGAQRMARRNALVRHLQAVETLGSTTFICTDKTGTLTRNEMEVVEAWTERGAVRVAEERGRWIAIGDPMEAAIDAFRQRIDPAQTTAPAPSRRFAFDPIRRRASVVVDDVLLVKGAPDSVLPRCRGDVSAASTRVDELAGRGLRVLAVARRSAVGIPADAGADLAESALEFLGLLALQDPPRPEATSSIAQCRAAGIRLAMVTGDHPSTARAIAAQIGMLGEPEIVLTGDALPVDPDALGALLDHDGVVVSRATPEHKLRIATALQARGHVVAMTGDGVNDGPALRRADIGVAMGASGTDVAREAADLVLLDDDFETIIAAVEEGRATYTNIRRFLTYHLTANVAELAPFVVWGLSGGWFPLAIGVLQVLCIDIVTDLLPALALGAEPPSPGLLQRPLRGRHLIDRPLLWRVFVVLGPTEALVELSAFLTGMAVVGWRWGAAFPEGDALRGASGAAFAAVVLGQVANAQACRSATRSPARVGWWSNHLLTISIGVQLVLLVSLLAVPPVAQVLDQTVPPPQAALVAAGAMPAVLLADSAHKAVRRRRHRSRAR